MNSTPTTYGERTLPLLLRVLLVLSFVEEQRQVILSRSRCSLPSALPKKPERYDLGDSGSAILAKYRGRSQTLYREVQKWNRLRHPNLQRVLGIWYPYSSRDGVFSLVSKGIKRGDIMAYIKVNPKYDRIQGVSSWGFTAFLHMPPDS